MLPFIEKRVVPRINQIALINGIAGRVIEVTEVDVTLRTYETKEDKKRRKNAEGKMEDYTEKRTFTEDIFIPISAITTVSDGEKEVEKPLPPKVDGLEEL
jgi:hypothetical protein